MQLGKTHFINPQQCHARDMTPEPMQNKMYLPLHLTTIDLLKLICNNFSNATYSLNYPSSFTKRKHKDQSHSRTSILSQF